MFRFERSGLGTCPTLPWRKRRGSNTHSLLRGLPGFQPSERPIAQLFRKTMEERLGFEPRIPFEGYYGLANRRNDQTLPPLRKTGADEGIRTPMLSRRVLNALCKPTPPHRQN